MGIYDLSAGVLLAVNLLALHRTLSPRYLFWVVGTVVGCNGFVCSYLLPHHDEIPIIEEDLLQTMEAASERAIEQQPFAIKAMLSEEKPKTEVKVKLRIVPSISVHLVNKWLTLKTASISPS